MMVVPGIKKYFQWNQEDTQGCLFYFSLLVSYTFVLALTSKKAVCLIHVQLLHCNMCNFRMEEEHIFMFFYIVHCKGLIGRFI